MNFPEAIQAQIEGRLVRVAELYEADFAGGMWRGWEGFRDLETQDGRLWLPTKGALQLDGVQQAINGDVPTQTIKLSGVDPTLVAKAKGLTSEYYLRPFRVYWQFFDEAWQTLDLPFAMTLRLMTNYDISMQSGEDGQVYEITMTAETPFLTPALPPYGYLTDRDQQTLYPGDRGLERTAAIDQKLIKFPG